MPSPGCCSLEGGFAPIDTEAPLYRGALDGLFIAALPLAGLVSREKLGAERPMAWRRKVVAGLWDRGAPGDLEALEALREAAPDTELPAALVGPAGVRLWVAPSADRLPEVAALLAEQYWHVVTRPPSSPRTGARQPGAGHDPGGELLGQLRGPSATALARPGSWTFASCRAPGGAVWAGR
ncbi:MAG: hypothetical protein R3F60_28425 [bacterium]